ncbi:class II aldolase/adducin family protein [Uliginosibacterium gangwonense]|uniref:class II aldolase/adducin family protein n=1 Tax=Uliginosibacterium gangwonense TaxID=392736 RepID=UPI00037E5A18|nr:class II aldolase/adducin family protein [Uliginosibacterium gangwonense]
MVTVSHQHMHAGDESAARASLLKAFRLMSMRGLNAGTAGNASLRYGDGFLITPSGIPAEELAEEDLVWLNFAGGMRGNRKPSSEWRLHHDILLARPEVGAVMHAHSPCATALACHGEAIPAFHYMVLRFGGPDVPCAAYATYGTQALSDTVLSALQERTACLMANHGMVVLGEDAPRAIAAAIEFESLCEHYWRARLLGQPRILSPQELAQVEAQFTQYGQTSQQ